MYFLFFTLFKVNILHFKVHYAKRKDVLLAKYTPVSKVKRYAERPLSEFYIIIYFTLHKKRGKGIHFPDSKSINTIRKMCPNLTWSIRIANHFNIIGVGDKAHLNHLILFI